MVYQNIIVSLGSGGGYNDICCLGHPTTQVVIEGTLAWVPMDISLCPPPYTDMLI